MRLVKLRNLKEGDIIARDVIGIDGRILLRKHTYFREAYKIKLIQRNIFEVFIDDEMSKGIEPEEALPSEVKRKITGDIKTQFEKLQGNIEINSESLAEVARLMVEQLQQKEMVLELEDLKANDNYTYEHCISVAILSNIVCNKLGMKQEMKEQIVMGALIHDIGKMDIPKEVLNKPGRLTEEEYEIMKTHVHIGYKMIKDNHELSAITKLTVLCHHEREDGSGYPLQKKEELHISAKIVGACDLFHALISDRCYRKGLPLNEVVAIAETQAINPKIREIIINSLCYYPVGCMVQLSDGKLAIVEKNYATDIKRPLVRIVEEVDGKYTSSYRVNLAEEQNIDILGRYENPISC